MRTFPGLQCQKHVSKSRTAAKIERGGRLNVSTALLWDHRKAPEVSSPEPCHMGTSLERPEGPRLSWVELALACPGKADRVLKKTVGKGKEVFSRVGVFMGTDETRRQEEPTVSVQECGVGSERAAGWL